MNIDNHKYLAIKEYCELAGVTLVAVSKTKPVADILELYQLGHRDFGENYVQELVEKHAQLPVDIRWHFIGHLQSNKVKYIAPFVHLIHGVDSFKLLKEINKQGLKNNRIIAALLQVHIAREETKFGFDERELDELVQNAELPSLTHVYTSGLMGMASFSDDENLVRSEFKNLKRIFDCILKSQISDLKSQISNLKFQILSMGMSGDYKTAIEEGSNMVRIGSLIFGAR